VQYPGKAPPPYVESHRLPPEATARHGLHPIDPETINALRAIRQRKPPRDPVRGILAIVGTLVLHIFIILLVQYEMQPRPFVGFAKPDDKADVLEVRFIEPTPAPPPQANVPPPPPVSEPPPKVRSPEATRPEPPVPKPKVPAKTPAPAENEAPAAPAPSLFGKDGQVHIAPAPTAAPTTQADFVARKPTDEAGVMAHKGPVTYKETRFEKDWAPENENVLNGGIRKAMEATTLKKEVNVGGTRINCATVFFVLPVGCRGEDPPKPPPKSADGRLNMAPAHALADGPDVVKPPSEVECIAAFRADKPLPQGCPSDVPLKAIDQEKAEQDKKTR
jgi:outer membrane biosynthesis protein TonB